MIYRLNPNKSMVNWHGTDASEPNNGMMKFKAGTIVEEFNKFVEGKLELDMLTLEMHNTQLSEEENQQLTEQLKSNEFLSTKKFPEASFNTKEVYDHKDHLDLKGILKLKGYAFGFSLPVKINKSNDQLMLEGNLDINDINPAITQFISGGNEKLPDIEIDYKIIADPVKL